MTAGSLRVSRYNVLGTDPRSGTPVVFNGVSRRLVALKPRVAAAVAGGTIKPLLPGERQTLLAAGVLVRDHEHETTRLRQRFERLRQPGAHSTFVVSPCSACNLSCPYCYQQAMTPRPAVMTREVEDRVIAFIIRMMSEGGKDKAILKFYGGEPLLAVDRCRSIAARTAAALTAAGRELFTWIHTNGTLIGDDTFAGGFPALGCVEMTLDGPRRRHDTVRVGSDREPSFDRIAAAVVRVSQRGIPVVLRINVQSPGELDEALADMTARGLSELPNLTFYDGRVGDCFDRFTRGEEAGGPAQEKAAVDGSLAVRKLLADSPWRHRYQVYPIFPGNAGVCGFAVRGNFCIDPLGDLYLCIFQQGAAGHKIGTIGDGGRPEFLPSYEEIMTRSPFDHPECVACACRRNP